MSEVWYLVSELRDLVRQNRLEQALRKFTSALGPYSPLLNNAINLESRLRLINDTKIVRARDEQLAERSAVTAEFLELITRCSADHTSVTNTGPNTRPDMPTDESRDRVVFERVLGPNKTKPISWMQDALKAARSVCRLRVHTLKIGVSLGSGFLIATDLIITNNHVAPSEHIDVDDSFAEFDYQADIEVGYRPSVRYKFDEVRFYTSKKLDYTIVGLKPNPTVPIQSWGKLILNAEANPIPSELVTIVQHPNAEHKRIASTDNQVIAIRPPWLYYTTDTMPGSSGSPVFNDSWHVIAIHHRGPQSKVEDRAGTLHDANEGILVSAIREDREANWPDWLRQAIRI